MKLGDVHLKRGDKQAAIDTYKQVAARFSKSGFDAKAVAIYKQILRIDESYLEARIQLGDHFQRMGLPSDALREFQEAVKLCRERGLKRDAFDLLKRVAALDPANVTNRLSLADLLLREELRDEAREEYLSLLEEVAREEDQERIVKVGERLAEAFPDEERGHDALSRAQLALGNAEAALATLTRAVPMFDTSISLRESLVGVYDALGKSDAARGTWREIAKLYKQRGDDGRARDIVQRHCAVEAFDQVSDTAPSLLLSEETDEEPSTFDPITSSIELTEEEPALGGAAPPKVEADAGESEEVDFGEIEFGAEEVEEPPAAEPPAAAAEAASPDPEELLAEAKVSLEFDDPESAAEILRQILGSDPRHAEARKLLAKIEGGKKKSKPAAAKASAKPAKAPPKAKARPEPEPEPDPGPASAPSVKLEEDPTAGLGASLPDIELVLEDEGDSDDDFISIEPPTHVDLAPLTADQTASDTDFEPTGEIEIDFDLDGGAGEEEEEELGSSYDTSAIGAQLAEAEQLFEAESWSEAERVYQAVLAQKPNHPQALVRLGELASRKGDAPDDISKKKAAAKAKAKAKTEPEVAPPAIEVPEVEAPSGPALDIDAELEVELADLGEESDVTLGSLGEDVLPHDDAEEDEDELAADEIDLDADDDLADEDDSELFDVGSLLGDDDETGEPEAAESEEELFDAASLVEDEPEEEPVAAEAASALEADDETDASGEVLDAAALLAEHEEEEAEEKPVDDGDGFDLAAALDGEDAPPIDMEQSGAGFEAVFSAFKKGIQEQIPEEEAGAHYDLAIAYREMGLFDDAIEQLDVVCRSDSHMVEGLSLMAHCKMELGHPEEAAAHLAQALGVADESDGTAVAVGYELGCALVAAGKSGEALDAFKKVAASDPDFRDVQEQISELE